MPQSSQPTSRPSRITFAAQAIFLCIAALLTSRLRPSPADRGDAKEGIFSNMVAGLKYVVRDRRMGQIVTMAILPSILVYPYVTFLPVFATDVLHKDQTAYGYLAAAVGLGSLLGGGIVAATSNRERLGPPMMWGCFFYCASVGAFTLSRNLWLAVAVLAVAGIFHSVYSAFNASLMQMKAEPEYRSRVVALQTMTWGLTPFAGLLMGKMIDIWGAPHVVGGWMVLAAVLTLAITAGSRELRRI